MSVFGGCRCGSVVRSADFATINELRQVIVRSMSSHNARMNNNQCSSALKMVTAIQIRPTNKQTVDWFFSVIVEFGFCCAQNKLLNRCETFFAW